MARSRPTLFEQLQGEDRQQERSSGLATSRTLRIVLLTLSIILVMFFLPGGLGESQQEAGDKSRIGTTWSEESIIAQYPFPVLKDPDSLAEERRRASADVPPYILRVADAPSKSIDRFLASIRNAPDSLVSTVRTNGLAALRLLYAAGFRSSSLDSIRSGVCIESQSGGEEMILSISDFRDSASAMKEALVSLQGFSPAAREIIVKGLSASVMPSITIDRVAWEAERVRAEQGVSTTSEIVHQGDVIVKKGDRIDEKILTRLSAYRFSEFARSTKRFSVLAAFGSLGHAIVLIAMLALYLYFVRRSSFMRNGQLATLLSMPVISAGLGWLSIILPSDLPLEYTIIVPGMAMLVSILYDVRTAIVVTLACSLSVAAARGNDHIIAVVLIAGGAMAAYSATNLRSRTQVFTSILAIAAGLAVVTVSLELERATALLPMLLKLGGTVVNAILSPLFALAVILVMERTMNLATDLRLEDFDDINHPLIHQLNEHAPGTYQHTMSVVHLSETAASAIGANTLLTRVGALYHDIGKIEKSEYFIENQIGIDNKHDRLTPKKSATIIRQHVQGGIALANDNKLPDRIWKFIPMHHGTMMIKHFYAKALEDAATEGGQVEEADFRYPGPKPDSKETAIVMLADAVEALSRLVDTSQRHDIEKAVDQIVLDRINDGQLGDSPLTMHDIDIIKESFVKTLLGSSHQRVRYMEVKDDAGTGTS
jgi:putative nucleotidyltransferase with HDIG domain